MKEIGGFLELESNYGHEFHENCIALNSGRNCLRYLICARDIKKILLPKLLCSAISDVCKEEQVEICYYSVDSQLRPVLADVSEDTWVYLINYYGQYNEKEISLYRQQFKNVIVDNAQAFYVPPIDGIDTIYTCRKFFGVPDGGYLYTDYHLMENLQQDESYDRLKFLAGRFECSANEFYAEYRKNEELIDRLPLKTMSKITHNLLQGIDYSKEAEIREENFKYLYQHLKSINLLKVSMPDGPYMYPLYIENGAEMRKRLQEDQIYVPLLWPNVKQDLNPADAAYSLADNILPLPCDQRYTEEDMEYVLEKIIRLEKL